MTDSRTGDAARVMDALRRSVRALRAANVDAKRRFGIGAAPLFVLSQIADAPGLSVAELADRTQTGQSSVSEVVSRLVEHGLVKKTTSASDRRRVVLHLTDEGAAIASGSGVPVQERLISGLGALSADERRSLADLYETWLRAAGLETVAASMFFEPARSGRAS